MAVNRELIFSTLFTRLQTQLAGTVVDFSRRWTSWDDKAPAQQPALLLLKGKEVAKRMARGAPLVWTLHADIWVYAQDDGTGVAVPSIQINQILTAIEGALEIQPNEPTVSMQFVARRDAPPASTSLGGLVDSCQIGEEIEVMEGTQGHVCVVRIPLEIMAAA
jgi:hypothetical protein